MAPKRTTFKAFEIEQKIGVNIEFNINPDFLFDLKELSMPSFWVRFNRNEYMLELNLLRKNKVNLSDYNSQQDIENRILISDFSPLDLKVLEEILFSPLKISLKKLTRSLLIPEKELALILRKLAQSGLLSIQDDSIIVDKEIRKCFEFQIQRFDPNFKPDMEFLQGLLRKVPIHLLPIWYATPRSSNNLFESIIEKHLLTPQIFQRFLDDLIFSDCAIQNIMNDLFSSEDFTLSSSDVIAKYNLTRHRFEEIMLLLEFNFVCTVRYVKEEDHWHEIITPFYEWHQYLRFLQATKAPVIDSAKICRKRQNNFAFVEDMSKVLAYLQKQPKRTPIDLGFEASYLSHLCEKLCQIQLADRVDGHLCASTLAVDWQGMTLENKALYLYRHSLNHPTTLAIPPGATLDRNLREAEKSIRRALHGGWIFFDIFIQGAMVPLNVDSIATLKKIGNHWKYNLPIYSDAEKEVIHAAIFETLFECGMVAIGTCDGRDCFAVTPFGCSFFV